MQFRFDDFVLDLDAYRLERRGVPVSLEPKAFDVLALLVRRPEHLFTKQAIFDAVWPNTAVTDHALTRVVAQLRRVLGDEAREATYIETIPTRGYRWIRPVELVTSSPSIEDGASDRAVAGSEGGGSYPAGAVDGAARATGGWWSRGWHPSSLVAVVLLAAVAIALVLWTGGAAGPVSDEPTAGDPHAVQWPVQLTTHPGLDLHPAFSPQGDAIAYMSDRSGAFEIYVRGLSGTATETALTTDRGHNVQPAWSPDGRFIAYHSYRRGGIWVVPARGGVPRQVAATGSKPAWSPDSRLIAYQSDEHVDATPSAFGAQSGSTIWIVGADGHGARAVTRAGHPVGGHAAPAWNSDGRYIAFTLFEGGPDNGVWLLTVDSGETRPVARGPGLYDVVVAPDDSAIYAVGGEALLVRIPFNPDHPSESRREVIPVPGVPGVRGLSISADGRRLAFAGPALNSHIWAQPVTSDGVPQGAPRALTDDTSRRNSLPVVSPDGTRVAYMSTRTGTAPHVWVMDIDGQNRIQVSADETANFKPNWFPDGRRVAFLSNRSGRLGVWAVDVATRREELWLDVATGPTATSRLRGRLAEFDLSPSSTRAAFSMITEPAGHRVTYAASLTPFQTRELTDGSLSVGYPSWSPDERSLAVEVKDGASTHAGVLDVETGTLRLLTRERGETWVRSWSPDGRKVAFAALRGGAWNLQWADVVTGLSGNLTTPLPPSAYVRYPEWSPRGDLVVYERGELRGNIWLVQLR